MNSGADIRVITIHDLESDPGAVEIVVARIEKMSVRVFQNGLDAHRSDFYQVLWITQGSGKAWIDLESYPIQPNMMCFVSPGQIHGFEVESPAAGFLLAFTHRFFSSTPDDTNALVQLPFFFGAKGVPVFYTDEEHAVLFTEVCHAMEREKQSTLIGQAAVLRSYMRIVLINARRMRDTLPATFHTEEAAYFLTHEFLRLVETHYLKTSTVADYGAMLHVSTNHLIETVRRSVGESAGKIVKERRLLEAKRLLRYSELPVAEIADRLNFEDPSYFTRYFKKKTGVPPSEYRIQP